MKVDCFRWCLGLASAIVLHLAVGAAGASAATDAIGRANLDGSGVTSKFIVASRGEEVGQIAVDGTHIYWVQTTFGKHRETSQIGRADLDGRHVNRRFVASKGAIPGVAVTPSYLYWSEFPPKPPGFISRANLDGSGVDPTFIRGRGLATELTADATHLYWASSNARGGPRDAIGRANLDGTGVEENFITGLSNVVTLMAGSRLYWSTSSSTIGRANLDGNGVQRRFMTVGGPGPDGVAVNAKYIYWSEGLGGNRIGRANLDGSHLNPRFIVAGRRTRPWCSSPSDVVVDGAHIYWAVHHFNPCISSAASSAAPGG